MKKQVSKAFGKKVYLLGKDKKGIKYWLEEPRWECDWYWGFGYIETYENNDDPENARDIDSHQHADDFYPKWWGEKDSILTETTFNKDEGWKLADLFRQFYMFQGLAEYMHIGHTGMTQTKILFPALEREELYNRLNKEIIPQIFKQIEEILTPKGYTITIDLEFSEHAKLKGDIRINKNGVYINEVLDKKLTDFYLDYYPFFAGSFIVGSCSISFGSVIAGKEFSDVSPLLYILAKCLQQGHIVVRVASNDKEGKIETYIVEPNKVSYVQPVFVTELNLHFYV